MTEETEPKSRFAARLGVSKARVSQLINQGLPLNNGKVPVNRAIAWLRENGRLASALEEQPEEPAGADQPGPAADQPAGTDPALDALADRLARGDLLSWSEAQRVKENYLARLRQLEYHRKSEELVDVDAVISEVARRFNNVRSRLMQLPYQAAPRVAGQDATTVASLLFEDVRDILTELSGRHSADDGRDVAEEALDRERSR